MCIKRVPDRAEKEKGVIYLFKELQAEIIPKWG